MPDLYPRNVNITVNAPAGSPTWQGNWSSSVTYVVGDAVARNGSAYVANAETTNDPPPSSNWDVLAQGVGTSANLAGSPTTTTQSVGDSSTKIATTAFVTTAVDNAVAGVNPAVAVTVATAAILPNSPTYNNGASGVGAFITTTTLNTNLVVDGHTVTLGERVLVKDESGGLGAAKNGIYRLSQAPGVALAWILIRASDFNQPSDINFTGAIPVISGDTNATTQWVVTSTVNTVGTDAVTFTQFGVASGGGSTVQIVPINFADNDVGGALAASSSYHVMFVPGRAGTITRIKIASGLKPSTTGAAVFSLYKNGQDAVLSASFDLKNLTNDFIASDLTLTATSANLHLTDTDCVLALLSTNASGTECSDVGAIVEFTPD